MEDVRKRLFHMESKARELDAALHVQRRDLARKQAEFQRIEQEAVESQLANRKVELDIVALETKVEDMDRQIYWSKATLEKSNEENSGLKQQYHTARCELQHKYDLLLDTIQQRRHNIEEYCTQLLKRENCNPVSDTSALEACEALFTCKASLPEETQQTMVLFQELQEIVTEANHILESPLCDACYTAEA